MPKLINYGKKDMDKETALITIFVLFITIFFILYSDLLVDVPTLNSVVSSNYLSDEALAIFRTLCAILSLVTLAWVALDPKDLLIIHSTSKNELIVKGIHRA